VTFLQRIQALQQRPLLIRLPEKAGVVEARTKHTLVAMTDEPLRIFISIQHRKKMRQQLAARIFQRKIFLVVAHHRDQYFFRQGQELRIESAKNDRGKFGEVDYAVEEGLVFPPARSGNRTSARIERFANLLLALTAS
jgi:hypothetical protein